MARCDEGTSSLYRDTVVESIRAAISHQHELQVYAVLLLKPGSIPKTSSGKIQRHACKQGFESENLNLLASWQAEAEVGSRKLEVGIGTRQTT